VNATLEEAVKVYKGDGSLACSFFNLGTRPGVGMVNAMYRQFYPGKKTRYPCHKRLGGAQEHSELVRKTSPQTEFDPRTVYSVASRYKNKLSRPTRFVCKVAITAFQLQPQLEFAYKHQIP
jgi:hypothetical protein